MRTPFDLHRSLAGDRVVTRDGRKIDGLAYFPKAKEYERVAALIVDSEGSSLEAFSESGRWWPEYESGWDLFMEE